MSRACLASTRSTSAQPLRIVHKDTEVTKGYALDFDDEGIGSEGATGAGGGGGGGASWGADVEAEEKSGKRPVSKARDDSLSRASTVQCPARPMLRPEAGRRADGRCMPASRARGGGQSHESDSDVLHLTNQAREVESTHDMGVSTTLRSCGDGMEGDPVEVGSSLASRVKGGTGVAEEEGEGGSHGGEDPKDAEEDRPSCRSSAAEDEAEEDLVRRTTSAEERERRERKTRGGEGDESSRKGRSGRGEVSSRSNAFAQLSVFRAESSLLLTRSAHPPTAPFLPFRSSPPHYPPTTKMAYGGQYMHNMLNRFSSGVKASEGGQADPPSLSQILPSPSSFAHVNSHRHPTLHRSRPSRPPTLFASLLQLWMGYHL